MKLHLRSGLVLRTLAAMLTASLASSSFATPPASTPSANDLIAGLGGDPDGGLPRKAFRRTPAPDSATHACPDAPSSAPASGDLRSRNLVLVSYANDNAPTVNLDIRFVTNSDNIEASSQPTLNNLAAALLSPSLLTTKVAVAGHTDAQGALENNMKLSCARAIAVRNYLTGRGIGVERLGIYGFGPNRPLEKSVTVSSVNRRVEIRRAD